MDDSENIINQLPKILELPESGYLRQSQLIPDILPFSPATLWRLVKARKFPRPIKLSARVTAWRVSDIREWLNNLHTLSAV